jgi:hypothetical protein
MGNKAEPTALTEKYDSLLAESKKMKKKGASNPYPTHLQGYQEMMMAGTGLQGGKGV